MISRLPAEAARRKVRAMKVENAGKKKQDSINDAMMRIIIGKRGTYSDLPLSAIPPVSPFCLLSQ